MSKEFDDIMKPLLKLVTNLVKTGAADDLEASIIATQEMMDRNGGGYAGPIADPEAQARMRLLVMDEEADDAAPVEYSHAYFRWERVREAIIVKLAR